MTNSVHTEVDQQIYMKVDLQVWRHVGWLVNARTYGQLYRQIDQQTRRQGGGHVHGQAQWQLRGAR